MSFFTALVTSKIAAGVLVGGTVAAGGTAAAAYSGTLPEPLQETSHVLLGAPAPAAIAAAEHKPDAASAAEHKPDAASYDKAPRAADAPESESEAQSKPESEAGADPVGPDAAGPAAFGLCTAFTKGGLDPASTAYKSLVTAAAGSADIAAYCASVQAPGRSAEHRSPKAEGPGASASPQNGKPLAPGEQGRSHKPAKAGKS